MVDTIIWDWNGTLLDDVDVCISAINRLLKRRGLEAMDRERYHRIFTFPVRDYYVEMGFDFARESFDDVAIEYHDAYSDLVEGAALHSGVQDLLGFLSKQGVRQAVLSALEETRLVAELERRNIHGFFQEVRGLANLHAVSKADRGRELLTVLQAQPQACWLLGDTKHDADVARELSLNCALVTCGHNPKEILATTGFAVYPDPVSAIEMILAGEAAPGELVQ